MRPRAAARAALGQAERLHRQPGRRVGVAAGGWVGQVGGEREVGDRDHAHPRVAVGSAVAAQLLQVYAAQPLAAEPGLLGQLTSGTGGEVLVGLDEAAGQRPVPLEGWLALLDQQEVQRAVADGQRHHVDGHGDRRG